MNVAGSLAIKNSSFFPILDIAFAMNVRKLVPL